MGSATEDVGLLVRKWESASTWADERLELERELELERRRAADADAEREEAENARAEAEVARDELLERLAALERTGPGVETAASESKADGLAKQAEIERLEEELTNCRSMLNAQKRQRAAAESSVAAGSDGAAEELGLVMHSWEAAATDSERDNLVKQAEIERLEEELAGKQCDLDAALARTTEQTRLYSEAKRQIEELNVGMRRLQRDLDDAQSASVPSGFHHDSYCEEVRAGLQRQIVELTRTAKALTDELEAKVQHLAFVEPMLQESILLVEHLQAELCVEKQRALDGQQGTDAHHSSAEGSPRRGTDGTPRQDIGDGDRQQDAAAHTRTPSVDVSFDAATECSHSGRPSPADRLDW